MFVLIFRKEIQIFTFRPKSGVRLSDCHFAGIPHGAVIESMAAVV